MAGNVELAPHYAIFRTRLQPYTVAHQWAIDNFLHWANEDAFNYTHDATNVILAIVDPELKMKAAIRRQKPRFSEKLNPFNDWMSAVMAHETRCDLKELSPHNCNHVVITRMPSTALLATKDARGSALMELRKRLPLTKESKSVWYFPCFDEEDLLDIEVVWERMKDESIPPAPIVVGHHSQFHYQLVTSRDDDSFLGIYAAAICDIAGFDLQTAIGTHPVVPSRIKSLISTHFKGDFPQKLKNCIRELEDPGHALLTDRKFSYVDAKKIVSTLTDVHDRIFGNGDISKDLSYLPPDKSSPAIRSFLLNKVVKSFDDHLGDDELVDFIHLKEEVHLPLMASEKRALEIVLESIEIVNQKFSRKKGLFRDSKNWTTEFNAILKGCRDE